ncbi:CheR family methyltransferase [Aurantivibrio infirmus]
MQNNTEIHGEELHNDIEICAVCDFLQENFGISIAENKYYLVKTKLKPLLVKYELRTFGQLLKQLLSGKVASLRQEVADLMATNETFWFRDQYPYEYLKKVILPKLASSRSSHQEIRIWSMACSSGQEPYSISMIASEWMSEAKDNKQMQIMPVRILATDLSSKMIDYAKVGVYDKFSMTRGLDEKRKYRFFEQESANRWRIDSALRSRIEFRQFNLLNDFSLLGKFDIIFCRNVLIYFTPQLKQLILRRISSSLRDSGCLVLGSSEGINESEKYFNMLQTNPGVIFQKK